MIPRGYCYRIRSCYDRLNGTFDRPLEFQQVINFTLTMAGLQGDLPVDLMACRNRGVFSK